MLRYLIGLVVLLVALGVAYGGVRALRRATMPQWTGAAGALVDALGMVTVVIMITQILGLLGILGVISALVAYVATGFGLLRLAARITGRTDVALAPAVDDRLGRAGPILTTTAIAAGLGPWIVRAAVAFTGGMPGADTQWYHLPAAAKLVQSGSLRQIEFFDSGGLTAYYPLAATFFHANGMLFLESDILSPLMNLAWVILALLACWLIGRPYGVQSATAIGGAVSLSFPGFVGHNGGSAMNDIVAMALVLGALAVLVNADTRRLTTSLPALALAGFATGAALGTKWTIIPATVALTLAVLVTARRGPWLRSAAVWLAASGSLSLFTYGRNLLIVGNPLPPRDLKLGPIEFEAVRDSGGVASIASWLTEDGAWESVFRPGVSLWFGPLWWAALALAALGLLVGLALGPGVAPRIAAFTGLVSGAGYLLMPQNLEVFGGPNYFLSNLRYGIVAITLGFIALPLTPRFRQGPMVWISPTAMLLLLATSLTADGAWTGIDDWRYQDVVGNDDTIVGLIGAGLIGLAGLAILQRPTLVRPLVAGGAGLALLAGIVFFDTYTDERYAEPFHEAHELEDARVAVTRTAVQYMFYGRDLGNHVQFVGRVEDGVLTAPTTCSEWITELVAGDYTHVVMGVGTEEAKTADGPYRWTNEDPATTLLRDRDPDAVLNLFGTNSAGNVIALFSVDGDLDPSRCTA